MQPLTRSGFCCLRYFFETDGGKKIRPSMVLAVSYALNAHQEAHRRQQTGAEGTCQHGRSSGSCGSGNGAVSGCGSGYGRDVRTAAASTCTAASDLTSSGAIDTASMFATPQQKRLAEITEMIHTASLFHDDVIDKVRPCFVGPTCCSVAGHSVLQRFDFVGCARNERCAILCVGAATTHCSEYLCCFHRQQRGETWRA
jgi:hypothetical protein